MQISNMFINELKLLLFFNLRSFEKLDKVKI